MKKLWLPHKLLRGIIIVLSCLIASGCWDRIELQEMSIIMGMGIDRSENGATRVTVQIIDTSGAGAGKAGKVQKGKAQEGGNGYLTLEEQAPSLEEAMQKFFQKSGRRMFFSHIAIIVFGNGFAEQGIGQTLEYFERSRDFRRIQLLAVTSGTAAEVLNGFTGVEPVTAKGIQELIFNQINTSIALESSELQFDQLFLASSHSSILTWVDNNSTGEVVLKGIGVFQGGRLTGLIPGTKSRGVLWFLNKVKRAQLELPCEKDNERTMIEVQQAKVKVKPVLTEVAPLFQVSVKGEGVIRKLCTQKDLTAETIHSLEKKLSEAIQKEMESSLSVLRKNQTDAVEFGTKLFIKDPRAWRKIATEWPSIFPNCRVEYSILIEIKRPGMNTKPVQKVFTPENNPPTLNLKGSGE